MVATVNCYWLISVWLLNTLLNVNCYTLYDNGRYTVSYPSYELDSPRKLCGAALTDALMAVCHGNTHGRDKKFDSLLEHIMEYDNIDDDDTGMMSTNPEQQRFFMPNMLNPMIDTRRLKRAGIVEECCRKPCSKQHLSAYCTM